MNISQFKSLHFLLVVLASAVGLASQIAGLPPIAHNALLALMALLGASGYQSAVNWVPPTNSKNISGGPLAALLIGSLAFGSTGCAHIKAIAQTVLDCGAPAVETGAPVAIQDVVIALSGGAPDWAALGELEAKYGMSVVGCVVKSLLGQVLDAPKSLAEEDMNIRIKNNAAAYLKAKNLR